MGDSKEDVQDVACGVRRLRRFLQNYKNRSVSIVDRVLQVPARSRRPHFLWFCDLIAKSSTLASSISDAQNNLGAANHEISTAVVRRDIEDGDDEPNSACYLRGPSLPPRAGCPWAT